MDKPKSASRIKRSRKTMEPRHVQNLGKIARAFFIFLAAPAASFAMMAGEAKAGNLQTSGIPLGPANACGMNNVLADPSGIETLTRSLSYRYRT
jgi:hypothetical protein